MIRRKAAGAIALIAIPSAFAAGTTYTVKAGTHTSGSASYSGSTSKISFKDTTSGIPLGCKGGTADGKVALGTHVAASKLGTITKTTWKSCNGPLTTVLVPVQKGTWKLNASGKTSKGVTKVFVSNVVARVHQKGAPGNCTFTVSDAKKRGGADGEYSNSTHKLTLAPGSHTLKVSHAVGGCYNVISNGDTVTFKATYTLTGKISVISN
jgi:hypothetical protein